MDDDFFVKQKCDRCGGSLASGRIMSMLNEECICMECKEKEKQLPNYQEAVKKDIESIKKKTERHICPICKKEFIGHGNNGEPYLPYTSGPVCDKCNWNVIIPYRMGL